jgi:hypothetical protein
MTVSTVIGTLPSTLDLPYALEQQRLLPHRDGGRDANGAIIENAGARDGVQPLDQVPIALRGRPYRCSRYSTFRLLRTLERLPYILPRSRNLAGSFL